jgi:hypothetical protein
MHNMELLYDWALMRLCNIKWEFYCRVFFNMGLCTVQQMTLLMHGDWWCCLFCSGQSHVKKHPVYHEPKFNLRCRIMAHGVSHQPLTMKGQVSYKASQCEICDGQAGIRTGFSQCTLVSYCQYHSTSAPHSFIYLSQTLFCLAIDSIFK